MMCRAALCGFVLLPVLASADLAPPPRDRSCTVERQTRAGEECRICDEHCEKTMKPPYERRCVGFPKRSVRRAEVWCRPAPASSSAQASSVSATKAVGSVLAFVAVAAVVGAAVRGRRRGERLPRG
jgi:hypothetical protein